MTKRWCDCRWSNQKLRLWASEWKTFSMLIHNWKFYDFMTFESFCDIFQLQTWKIFWLLVALFLLLSCDLNSTAYNSDAKKEILNSKCSSNCSSLFIKYSELLMISRILALLRILAVYFIMTVVVKVSLNILYENWNLNNRRKKLWHENW